MKVSRVENSVCFAPSFGNAVDEFLNKFWKLPLFPNCGHISHHRRQPSPTLNGHWQVCQMPTKLMGQTTWAVAARRPPRSMRIDLSVRTELPWFEGKQIRILGVDENVYPTGDGSAECFDAGKVGDEAFGFRIEQGLIDAEIVVIAMHQ